MQVKPEILALVSLWSCLPLGVLAHTVDMSYKKTAAIQIRALHSGKPMVDAKVTVAPLASPEQIIETGTTDRDGHFVFVPDRLGTWQVKVWQSGHGGVITIGSQQQPQTSSKPTPPPAPEIVQAELNPAQKAVMTGSVIWGLLGTALFFSRRK